MQARNMHLARYDDDYARCYPRGLCVYAAIVFAKRKNLGGKRALGVSGRLHVIYSLAGRRILEGLQAPDPGERLGEFRDV